MMEQDSPRKVPENRILLVEKVSSLEDFEKVTEIANAKESKELNVLVPGDPEIFSDDDGVMPIPLTKEKQQKIISQLPKEPLRDLIKTLVEGKDREATEDVDKLRTLLKEKEGWQGVVEKFSDENLETLREILQFSIKLGNLLLGENTDLKSILRVPNGSVLVLKRANTRETEILTSDKIYELFEGDQSRSVTTDEVVKKLEREAPELLKRIVSDLA